MFTAFLEWLFETVNKAVSGFATMVLTTVGADLTLIDQNFPAFQIYNDTVVAIGIALTVLICITNLIKSISLPFIGDDGENPVTIFIRTLVSVVIVLYSIDIMKTVLQFVTTLQAMILNTTAASTSRVYPAIDYQAMLGGFVVVSSGAFILLSLLLLILFAYNYLAVVIQLLQRYIYLGILTYASPLAFASLASRATHGIFIEFVKMYVGQCMLLLLTTWGVEIMMHTATNMSAGFLQYLLLLLLAKAITQFEAILNKLNLNTAPSGRAFFGELLVLRPLVAGAARGIGGILQNAKGPKGDSKGMSFQGSVWGKSNVNAKTAVDANNKTSKPAYDAKVVKTADGFRISKNSVDKTGQYQATKATIAAGAIGKDIDSNTRSILTGTGAAGVFTNLSDSRQRMKDTSAVVAERMQKTAEINSAIDRVNNAMSSVATSISGRELATGLNMRETNPNIELKGAFTHSGKNDGYLTGYASISNPRGETRDQLIAVSLNGADGLPGFFDSATYMRIGDTGARVYTVMSEKNRKAANMEMQYKAANEEAIEINQRFEQEQENEQQNKL